MALFKHFAITAKSMGFDFRAEAFNVFNHREYAWLGGGTAARQRTTARVSNSNNTLTCYNGASFSAGDIRRGTAANAYLRPAVTHNGRILQLGAACPQIELASPSS